MSTAAVLAAILVIASCAKDPGKRGSGDNRQANTNQNPVTSPGPVQNIPQTQGTAGQAGFEECGSQFSGSFKADINFVAKVPLVGNVNITANSDLIVSATPDNADFNIDITNFQTDSNSGLVKTEAEKQISKLKGKIVATFLPQVERTAVLATSDYQGIKCSVLIVKRFQGKEATLEFSPGIPFIISPLAPQLIPTELPGAKTWSNIKVTVIQSTKADLKNGETMTGSVSLTKLANQSSGLQGDHALKLDFKFGQGDKDLKRLGLFPSISYFVNSAQKTHNGLIIESYTYDVQKAPIVFKSSNANATASAQ